MDFFYICDFIWGLCIIASWAGWGAFLRHVLGITDRRSADWGLRAGWGAALTIAIGGVLNLCHISYQPIVAGLVLLGLVNEILGSRSRFRRWLHQYRLRRTSQNHVQKFRIKRKNRLRYTLIFIGPCVAALAFLYVGSIHQSYLLNPYDDYLAYLVFPIRMLQTGTLIEPFSQRRLGTFGGHAFLTAQVFSGSSPDMAWALEMGICPIIIAALIYGFLRPHKPRQYLLAGLLIVVSFITAVPRANTQSLATGVMLFLTLFRTLAMEKGARSDRSRIELVVLLVVAAVSTLRVNNVVAAFASLILFDLFSGNGRTAVARFKGVALDAAKAWTILTPWSILLFISSHTFLYPLMKGNEREFHLLLRSDIAPLNRLHWTFAFLLYGPVPLLLLPMLPAIIPHVRKSRALLAALCIAGGGVAATLVTVAGCSPSVSDYPNLYRFTYPLLFSATLAMLMTLAAARSIRSGNLAAGTMAALLLAMAILLSDPERLWKLNIAGLRQAAPSVALFSFHEKTYHDLQASIPEKTALLTILNEPNLLDYRRNDILNTDMLLSYGPYPGPPFFKGPEALKQYLLSLNIHYVAAVDFDQDAMSWYSRPNVIKRVTYSNLAFPVMQPYFFDYMHNIDLLEKSGRVLFRQDGIRVFRLDG